MTSKAAKILITVDENHRAAAVANIRLLLRRVGAREAQIIKDETQGIVQAWVPGDPRPLVEKLRRICRAEPDLFAGTHRWVPVESWAAPDPRDLAAYANMFLRSLTPEDSWKIEVRKHDSDVSTRELIDNIAALIGQPKVDLEHPNKILHVSALGSRLGFASLKPDQIFDTSEAAGAGPMA